MGIQASPGILSVVGTPIGNLADASPRVIDTLTAADVVLCEDTRVTAKLLSAFGVRASLQRCDEHIIASQVDSVLERLAQGQRVAFVSDAGMPGISDPGQRLVDAALDAGFTTEVIPGPSAVTCALVASGLACDHFFFEGFLPRKHGAQTERLTWLAAIPGALVIYESPRRVAATLARIAEVMPSRRVALVRELTKLHEEVVRDTAVALAAIIAARESLKGECVLIIAPPTDEERAAIDRKRASVVSPSDGAQLTGTTLEDAIREGLLAHERKSTLARKLSKVFSLDREVVYAAILTAAQNQ